MAVVPGFLARQAGGLMRGRTLIAGTSISVSNTVGEGNPTIALVTNPLDLTGGQIKFPATQNASSDANTLDDYEEGSWTPTDASGASLALANVQGFYVKVGRLVAIACRFDYPATADGSAAKIGGLPFTADSPSNVWGGRLNFTTHVTDLTLPVIDSTTRFELYSLAGAAVTNASMSGTVNTAMLVYRASA